MKNVALFLRWAGYILVGFGIVWVSTHLYGYWAESIGFKAIGIGLVLSILGMFVGKNDVSRFPLLKTIGKWGMIGSVIFVVVPYVFVNVLATSTTYGGAGNFGLGLLIIFIVAIGILGFLTSFVLYGIGRG